MTRDACRTGFDSVVEQAKAWMTSVKLLDVPPTAPALRTRLLSASPNPFNPRTTIEFELDRPGRADIRVYDAAGRQVAILVDDHRDAGPHRIEWDGRDHEGRAVAAGVYFYRMVADQFSDTKRMVLVK